MKKILLTFFILTATAFTCFAQHIESFVMSGEIGLPQGPEKSRYDYTTGFSVKFELPSKVKALKFIISGGYNVFVANTNIRGTTEADFLPVDLGVKYYIHRFYVEGEVGGSLNLNSNYSSSKLALLYAPTIGYTIQGLDFDEIDLGVGYQARQQTGGTLGQAFLHIAYKFNL